MNEQIVWSNTPSQKINFGFFLICGLVSAALALIPSELPPALTFIPIIVAFWQFLTIQSIGYELTTERLIQHSGIFSKTIDELELYRVRDYRIQQPLSLRIFGLSNIVLYTTDATTPTVIIRAVPNARELLNSIRGLVEVRRDIKGVRALDVPHV